jgi:hypothetical protein
MNDLTIEFFCIEPKLFEKAHLFALEPNDCLACSHVQVNSHLIWHRPSLLCLASIVMVIRQ